MADVTRSVHVRVLSYDPGQGAMVPVPSASLLVEHSSWLWDPNLSSGSFVTDADGRVVVDVTFDDAKENSLNPYFTITIPQANRRVPAAAPADRQIELPGEWVTRHYKRRRIPRISDHTTPARPLEIFVGLETQIRVAYSDFDASGIRNPFALPEDTAKVHLADYDTFLWIDFLNPDDTMSGAGFDLRANRIVRAGEDDRYPYADLDPTAPSALDGPADPAPRAWTDPPGSPVGALGGGSFDQVGPLATDAHGFVFMIDGNVVRRFYPDGTLCETITGPGFNAPRGLALDQHRHLYVADTGNDRVVMMVLKWGDGDTGVYEHALNSPVSTGLSQPSAVAVVPNRVVDGEELLAVADTGNDRVRVYRIEYAGLADSQRSVASLNRFLQLSHLTDFGATGAGAGQFEEPVGVAADRQRRLFVCDRTLHRVSRWALDAAGTAYLHEADWAAAAGGSGAGNREFDTPVAIATDTVKGYVYVAEAGNERVQRLDAETGNHLAHWVHEYVPALAGDFTPAGLAVDPRGEVYASDSVNRRVVRATAFDAAGAPLADGAEPAAVGSPWTPRDDAAHMREPGYVFFAPDGRLWVSDTGNDRVRVFERDAAGRWAAAAVALPAAGLTRPVGIARDGAGNTFVVDSGNHRVVPFDAALAAQAPLGAHGAADNQFDDPRGIAVAQRVEPILYVADRGNDRVQYLRRDGTFDGRLTTDGTTPFSGPEDVAVDSTGVISVADTGNGRIVRFVVQADGTHVLERAIPVPVKATGGVLPRPSGVAVDDRDNLLVTDRAQEMVFLLEADGDLLAYWDLRALLRQDHGSATLYEPDLARLLLFRAPARAVLDQRGVLAVADTGNDRVRLVRVFSEVRANLFDLGEGLPDVSFRAITKNRFAGDLGLDLNVGDVSIFDESHDFVGEPEDDFSLDTYRHRQILTKTDSTNSAVNVMKVIRMGQQWYHHHTRRADADSRWGTVANRRELNVDLISSEGSYQMLDVNMGEKSPHGRGSDAWDDSVLVHEMTHWVFFRAARPNPPMSLVGLWDISRSHNINTVSSFNQALSEGWANYVELFWGSEFGSVDRVRGYPMYRSLGRGGVIPRPSETLFEFLVHLVAKEPTVTSQYLFGGPASAALPTFDDPEEGLRNEGYFANALYQIHCALTDPERLFSDASSYWYRHNVSISDAQSQRFSDTIWGALSRFPNQPTAEEIDRGTLVYLRGVLSQFRSAQADFAQIAQSIFELNNQLAPTVTITEGTSATAPGTAVGGSMDVPAGQTRNLILQVRDATGAALRGYNLRLQVANAAEWALPGGAGPVVRHGQRGTATATELYRATNANGIVNVVFTAPAAAGTQTLRVSYQPDFDTDETFDPPQKGDDRETVLRKLYLYELRGAAKTWGGAGTNFGARVTRTLTLRIT